MAREIHIPDSEESGEQLDRCLSCHWGNPENVRGVTVDELSLCTGVGNPAARLRTLRERGIATSSPVDNEWPRRLQFTPTDTAKARAYVAYITSHAGGPCMREYHQPEIPSIATPPEVQTHNITTTEAMIQANVAAEEFLLEKNPDIKSGTKPRRRQMLGCMACHFYQAPDTPVKARDIAKCVGCSVDSVAGLLESAHNVGLLTPVDEGRTPRTQSFDIAATEEGQTFSALLVPPNRCAYKAEREQYFMQQEQVPSTPLTPQ